MYKAWTWPVVVHGVCFRHRFQKKRKEKKPSYLSAHGRWDFAIKEGGVL